MLKKAQQNIKLFPFFKLRPLGTKSLILFMFTFLYSNFAWPYKGNDDCPLPKILGALEALSWANSIGRENLTDEYMARTQAILNRGSKDLQSRIRLWGLQSRFGLMQMAFKSKSLSIVEISRIFDIPLDIVNFWHDRKYSWHNGIYSL